MFGPFSSLTLIDSSLLGGASRAASISEKPSGVLILGTSICKVRGSVISPVRADAAAVSGLHKYTLSSIVPDRPGKLRGVVRKLFLPVAGACPIPIQPLQPA